MNSYDMSVPLLTLANVSREGINRDIVFETGKALPRLPELLPHIGTT